VVGTVAAAAPDDQDRVVAREAEYYRDPAAPTAQGVLPAAYAVVRDDFGRVLLVQRADDRNWELPGGRIDVGESAVEAVVREVGEEADVVIEVVGLSGVYSDPAHVLVYADEGVRQQLAVCFHAHPRMPRGAPGRPDGVETIGVIWVDPAATHRLQMHPAVRRRLADALDDPLHAHYE
jgi:8-oxo-dGTP pyrophosphatase MutT (NUDIX family)